MSAKPVRANHDMVCIYPNAHKVKRGIKEPLCPRHLTSSEAPMIRIPLRQEAAPGTRYPDEGM